MLKKIIQKIRFIIRSFFHTRSFKDALASYEEQASFKHGTDEKLEIPKLVIPRAKKTCPVCHQDMFVSIGQIVYTHRFNKDGYPCRRVSRGGYSFA